MAVIYVIKNEKNGKMYVGATTKSIKERWKYHCNDMNNKRCRNRKLYSALREYGKENFSIEEIETVVADKRFEREKYWINRLGTYRNGYNETLGGSGTEKLDDIELGKIINTYHMVGSMSGTSKETGIDQSTIKKALLKNGEHIRTSKETMTERIGIPVDMLSMDGAFQRSFESISSAAHYLVDKGYNNGNYCSTAQHIREVCVGEKRNGVFRRSVANHKWRYADKKFDLG